MISPTRRSFLKSSASLAATLSFAASRLPGATAPAAPNAPAPSASPRGLRFDAADLPRLRANFDHPRCADLRTAILGPDLAAEEKFLRTELRLNNHVADMLRARVALEKTSLAFAVFGDRQHLAVARLALRRLLDYKRWDYFLEAGKQTIGLQRAPEATIAVCCALDWLATELTAAERAEAEHKIAEEGAPACYRTLYGMKFPDRVRGWGFDPEDDYPFRFDLSRWPLILNSTNLKIIPTCGLGFAAVWLHGRHPEATKWLELSRQSAQAFATMYGLDGSYDEGSGYWGYTTLHLAMLAEVLHRRLGLDDRRLINYPGTARYALALAMPTRGDATPDPNAAKPYNAVPKFTLEPHNDVVNFSDAASLDVSVATWIGRTANDPLSDHLAQKTGGMKQWPALIWFRPEAPGRPPGADLHDVRLNNDIVISRTGWAAADTVVALRSGGPANHEHADRNSVIFKAHGERLFHDPFKAAYSPTSPRWLLRQTEAHSAVLIAGRGHQYHDGREGTNASWAEARVLAFRTGPGWMTVTSDATPAYELVNPDVTRVERTLVFLKPDVLLLLDRVTLKPSASPAAVQLRFQVFNDDERGRATATGATFRIERPQATLQARAAARGGVTCAAARLNLPEPEGVYPFAEVTAAAAREHVILTACTTAPAGQPHGELQLTREGSGWRVTGTHRGHAVAATLLIPADALPSVTFS
jgi:hypothetical protein